MMFFELAGPSLCKSRKIFDKIMGICNNEDVEMMMMMMMMMMMKQGVQEEEGQMKEERREGRGRQKEEDKDRTHEDRERRGRRGDRDRHNVYALARTTLVINHFTIGRMCTCPSMNFQGACRFDAQNSHNCLTLWSVFQDGSNWTRKKACI